MQNRMKYIIYDYYLYLKTFPKHFMNTLTKLETHNKQKGILFWGEEFIILLFSFISKAFLYFTLVDDDDLLWLCDASGSGLLNATLNILCV